jgi:hypothetical protein
MNPENHGQSKRLRIKPAIRNQKRRPVKRKLKNARLLFFSYQ